MSGLDVEALLDSTAQAAAPISKLARPADEEDRHRGERHERRDRDHRRDGSRDRERDRKRRDRDGVVDEDLRSPRSDRGSTHGSHRSRKRSRSHDSDRRHSHRDRRRDSPDGESRRTSGGDYYRGGGRTRSRSPDDDRYYRPSGRGGRRDADDRDPRDRYRGGRGGGRRRSPSPRKVRSKSPTPQLTEDERDRRTVFVQQLAARLRTKELIQFFEKVGPVKDAQIVKDRVSGRSKGYVSLAS